MNKSDPPEFTYDLYEIFIRTASDRGYKFISYDDLRSSIEQKVRCCVLRHDCDNDLPAALRMAQIEADLSVSSTYFLSLHAEMYNLLSPSSSAIVGEILALGHKIGLHFDCGFFPSVPEHEIADHVDWERALLQDVFQVPVDVMSFHQPSQGILDQCVKVRMMCTYDNTDMAGCHYVSDSNMSWRQIRPDILFQQERYEHIQFLIHPEWWSSTPGEVADRWAAMYMDNFLQQQEAIMKNEKSYLETLRIDVSRS